ncbi:MAG: hypothetical protein LBG83_01225 [Oscillospiraceae bacterium]|nr:hypothetical protein [Oscillospiraceae bacterium]
MRRNPIGRVLSLLTMLAVVTSALSLARAKYITSNVAHWSTWYMLQEDLILLNTAQDATKKTLKKGWWAIFVRGAQGGHRWGQNATASDHKTGDGGAGGVVMFARYFSAATDVYCWVGGGGGAYRFKPANPSVGGGKCNTNDNGSNDAVWGGGNGGGASVLAFTNTLPTNEDNLLVVAAGGGGGAGGNGAKATGASAGSVIWPFTPDDSVSAYTSTSAQTTDTRFKGGGVIWRGYRGNGNTASYQGNNGDGGGAALNGGGASGGTTPVDAGFLSGANSKAGWAAGGGGGFWGGGGGYDNNGSGGSGACYLRLVNSKTLATKTTDTNYAYTIGIPTGGPYSYAYNYFYNTFGGANSYQAVNHAATAAEATASQYYNGTICMIYMGDFDINGSGFGTAGGPMINTQGNPY